MGASRRNRLVWKLALSSALTSAALCAAQTAAAQTAASQTAALDEIVVTARKRVETLQNVPVSVSVVTQDQLRNNNATDLSKLAELAPQVQIGVASTGTGATLTIRGISSGALDSGLDQSVALDIDGVPLSRGRIVSAKLFDIQQVQVLSGPQALFFGKNAPAGVISVRTADPTGDLEGYVRAGYEFKADERFLEGAVSGPLTDSLRARLAFRASRIKGWIHNIAAPVADPFNPGVTSPGNIGSRREPAGDDYAARLSLTWAPSEDFEAKFKFTTDKQTRDGGNGTSEPFCIGGTTTPVLLGFLPIAQVDCKRDMVKASGALPEQFAANFPYGNGGEPFIRSHFTLGALSLTKTFDKLTITSTTGFYSQTITGASEATWSPYAAIYASEKERYTVWTQELRADTSFDGPVNVMAGVYLETFKRPWSNGADLFNAYNPTNNTYLTAAQRAYSKGDSYSLFGQVRWNITPAVELAAGARYSHDSKDTELVNAVTNASFPGLRPVGSPLSSSFKDSNVSPEATLTWRPQSNQTVYVAYKTGYKAGGLSNSALLMASSTPDTIRFGSEKAKGFEAGYKATLLDRRLRLGVTAYRYNYSGLQVTAYNPATISYTIGNAAKARTQGLEGSAEWLASQDLTLRGNVGYNRARYRTYPSAECYFGQTAATGCLNGVQDLAGRALIRAPNLTYSFGGDYRIDLGTGWQVKLAADAAHSGAYQTAGDYSPGGVQKAFWRLNAAAHLTSPDEKYKLSLVGRNLTNSFYMTSSIGWSASGNPDQYVGYFQRPREVLLEATYSF